MAGNSGSSAPNGRPRTTKTPRSSLAVPVIQPAEAVQILQSALTYCLQAGIAVRRLNSGTDLILVVPGVNFDGTTADLALVAQEPTVAP